MASIFNKTHIFRSEHSFLIYTEERKKERKSLNSNNHFGDTKFDE